MAAERRGHSARSFSDQSNTEHDPLTAVVMVRALCLWVEFDSPVVSTDGAHPRRGVAWLLLGRREAAYLE